METNIAILITLNTENWVVFSELMCTQCFSRFQIVIDRHLSTVLKIQTQIPSPKNDKITLLAQITKYNVLFCKKTTFDDNVSKSRNILKSIIGKCSCQFKHILHLNIHNESISNITDIAESFNTFLFQLNHS